MLYDPHVVTPTFLTITTLNFACNTSWVFISDRSIEKNWLVGLASFFLFMVAITNIMATAILARNIANHSNQLGKGGSIVKGVIYR